MKTIREWGFPICVILAWVLASAYTLSSLVEASGAWTPLQHPRAAVSLSQPAGT